MLSSAPFTCKKSYYNFITSPSQDSTRGYWKLTYDVNESKKFTEEISVGPEVVVLEIRVDVIKDQFLLQSLLTLGYNAQIKIHCECSNLTVERQLRECCLHPPLRPTGNTQKTSNLSQLRSGEKSFKHFLSQKIDISLVATRVVPLNWFIYFILDGNTEISVVCLLQR